MVQALQIRGFPNHYITDSGDVCFRARCSGWRIKKSYIHRVGTGYLLASISKNGKTYYKTGINQGGISDCCNKNRRHTGGCQWEYKE